MRTYRFWNNLTGWLVWAIATVVLVGTAERAGSWWDCGEYISTATKLMVGHPPGAPTFQLLGCLFGALAFGDVAKVGFMVNVMSALCSSFTILFLFWSITMLGRKLVYSFEFATEKDTRGRRTLRKDAPDYKTWQPTWPQSLLILGSAAVGALAFTFSDSFWFSAVEGEVYAMSIFFTAVTFWAILKWDVVADEPHNLRWLIFISFLIGLAIGVHLLNLLVIPAIVFVIYYRKFKPTGKRFWLSLLLSFVLLAFILWGIVPWTVKLAGYFELFFVNTLHAPFNLGTLFFFVLFAGLLVFGLLYAKKHERVILHTAVLCVCFLLIGYSTFFTLVIRANAEVPLNQGEVKNAISLLSYLNRDQYGSTPLVYGKYYNARLTDVEPSSPQYERNDSTHRYEFAGYSSQKLTYDDEHCGLFPRIHSDMQSGGRPCVTYNQIWSGHRGKDRPSFGQNIRYLWKYQLGWMYGRYFMWNFVGRQNDIMGRGFNEDGTVDVVNGNWISGIKFIDEMRLGPQDNLPRFLKENPARNTFFFLPLLLGLIGLLAQYRYRSKDCFVVFLLFFMTGIAIVLYLNQPSTEPRERDYAVVGSFYAFTVWIGLGVAGIAQGLGRLLKNKSNAVKGLTYAALTVVCLFAVPGIMAQQGWDDHDRSHRTSARDFGRNMLLSCEPNAVLISDGDNDTYPMWYCQHVERIRPDVRLINSILVNSSWLIQPLYTRVDESDPFRFTLDNKNYGGGKNDAVMLSDQISSSVELTDLLRFVNSSNPATKVKAQSGETYSFFPSRKIKLTPDKAKMAQSGLYSEDEIARTPETIEWSINGGNISKSNLVLLDLLANNIEDRPFYMVSPYGHNSYMPALAQGQIEGMVFRFVPFRNNNRNVLDNRSNGMNVEKTYDLLVNQFDWGEIHTGKSALDPETRSWSEQARHQYASLAMALIGEGQNEKAIEALDKGLYFFPDSVLEYSNNTILYAQAYFYAGAPDKGEDVLRRIFNNYGGRIEYFMGFPHKYQRGLNGEIQEAVNVVGYVRYLAEQNGLTDLATQASDLLGLYNVQI